jgi:hypothetical protein
MSASRAVMLEVSPSARSVAVVTTSSLTTSLMVTVRVWVSVRLPSLTWTLT